MEELKKITDFINLLSKEEKSILVEFKDKAMEFKADLKAIKNKLRDISSNDKDKYKTVKYEAISKFKNLIDELDTKKDLITKYSNQNGIMYHIFLGDINRYLVELHYNNDDENLEPMSLYVQNSLIQYRESLDLCADLPNSNELKIGTLLNLSVLIVDEMFNVDEGIKICEDYVLSLNLNELSEYGRNIYEVIIDNIDYWKKNKHLYVDENKFSN